MLAAGWEPCEVSGWMVDASGTVTGGICGHMYPVEYCATIIRFEAFVTGG